MYSSIILDGGERSASRSGSSMLGERAPDTHWIEGWVGPRAGPDPVEKRKMSAHTRNQTLAV
jgi:hypothetical protein